MRHCWYVCVVIGGDIGLTLRMFSGPPANTLEINISDGISLAVPATLRSLTAYVLLEQEHWFEKEIVFLREWLHSGMTAIDIGAKFGAYSSLWRVSLKVAGKCSLMSRPANLGRCWRRAVNSMAR